MLFGNADIDESIWKPRLKRQQPGWPGHRCSDRHDSRILFGDFNNRICECLRVTGRHRFWWTSNGVKHWGVVEIFFVVVFGRWVATTFLGDHVNHERTLFNALRR